MMIPFIKYTKLALILSFLTMTMLQAQTNLQVKDLFASESITKDSLGEYAQVCITFLVNRPEQVARVEFKIGENVDTQEVFSGIASVEMHGNKLYAMFNGKPVKLMGDKVTIYWIGEKAIYKDVKYVTIRVQANDGRISDRAFCYVRYF